MKSHLSFAVRGLCAGLLTLGLPLALPAQTTTLPDETPAAVPRYTPVPRPRPTPLPDTPVGTVNGQPIYRPLLPSELASATDRALVVYDYNRTAPRLSSGDLDDAVQDYKRAKFANSDARLDAKLLSLNATRADFRQYVAEEVKIHLMLNAATRGAVSVHSAQRAQAGYLARLREAALVNSRATETARGTRHDSFLVLMPDLNEPAVKPPTPAALGYRMPAEWEPHAATWLSWPRPEGISFPGGGYARAVPALVRMVGALAESEPVHINVSGDEQEAEVRRHLSTLPGGATHVRFFHIPTNEPWCRDHGAIFLTRADAPQLAALDFDYNAWGWKYPPFDHDDAVPARIAEALGGLPVFRPGLVLEGGSIEVNGAGTLLTTESCLLNPNRNPSLKKSQIEAIIRDYLCVRNILWLGTASRAMTPTGTSTT